MLVGSPTGVSHLKGERGPSFGVGDGGGGLPRRSPHGTHYGFAPIFRDIQLDQGARVEVQDQRRSSITIRETVFPLISGAFSRGAGLPPEDGTSASPRASLARYPLEERYSLSAICITA